MTANHLKTLIETAFQDFDEAMAGVLDHELGREEVAAISMGLSVRLVQLVFGREAEVDTVQVAATLCRELVALKGNTAGDMSMSN